MDDPKGTSTDPAMSFEQFDLNPLLLGALKAEGIETPTPIQEQAIPVALTGKDVVALAQTGTGKTLAFTLPSLTRLAAGKLGKNLMLVLVPTRELAVQVNDVIQAMGKPLKIRSTAVYGGVSLENQARALRRGSAVVVATPGRLLDHMGRGNVSFEHLSILAMDEADRMLDMGFLPDIRRILRKLPRERQTIMCSATFPREIARLAEEMLHEPERVAVGSVSKPVEMVRQILYPVHHGEKLDLLMRVLREKEPEISSALIFLRTKQRTERLATALRRAGFPAAPLHGDRSQKQRERALEGFRQGKYRILVATDVAARGIDVDGISHVINYDIPPTAEDYVHRIGRTARARNEGDAITFVCPDEYNELQNIEKALGRNLPREEWENAPPVLSLYRPPAARTATAGGRRRPSVVRRVRGLATRRR